MKTRKLVSTDAVTALTEYDSRHMQALEKFSAAHNWPFTVGYRHETASIVTKWPISLDGAGFKLFKGDPKYRDLHSATVEINKDIYQDGVAELKRVIEAPDWIGWQSAPENMAMAKAKKPAELVATALAGGEAASCFDGMFFFDTGKPYNPKKTSLGTYDNLVVSKPVSSASIAYWREHFRKMKNASGKNLGLRLTGFVVPPEQEEAWLDLRDRDFILEDSASKDASAATRNRYQGSFDVVVGETLSESTYYYPIAQNLPGLEPWVVLVGDDENLVLDMSSALYEKTRKVGFDSTLELGVGLTIPQAIARAKTTA